MDKKTTVKFILRHLATNLPSNNIETFEYKLNILKQYQNHLTTFSDIEKELEICNSIIISAEKVLANTKYYNELMQSFTNETKEHFGISRIKNGEEGL